MIKVVLSGYGRMGHMIEEVLHSKGIECTAKSENIQETAPALAKECVCIDFTTPDAFRSNYRFIAEHFKAAVIGTTGWNDIQEEVKEYFASCGTPMIYSSNYSVGVNVFSAAVELISKYLGAAGGYAPYIVEKHHIHKLDAPSGTAKSLAAVVEKEMNMTPSVASIRVGELAGTHTVGFEGASDRITVEHEAFSRKGFAEGAVMAAQMTDGLNGAHEFKELFFNKLK